MRSLLHREDKCFLAETLFGGWFLQPWLQMLPQTFLLAVGGCSKQAFLLWHRDVLQQPLSCVVGIWKSEQGRLWASEKILTQPVANTVVHSTWLIPAVHARGLSSAANPSPPGSPCWLTRSLAARGGRGVCPAPLVKPFLVGPVNTTVKRFLHLPLPFLPV